MATLIPTSKTQLRRNINYFKANSSNYIMNSELARTMPRSIIRYLEMKMPVPPKLYKKQAKSLYSQIGFWEVHKYANPPNPLTAIWVDPDKIQLVTGRAWKPWSNPEMAGRSWKPWASRVSYLGRVMDGDWDLREPNDVPEVHQPYSRQFDELGVHQALVDRFVNRQDWNEIEYIKKGMREGRYTEKRLERIDKLYNSIKSHGYKSQFEVGEYNDYLGCILNEINVDVGRNGELLFVDHRHRLSIAKILGINKIPVCVLVRHEKWLE